MKLKTICIYTLHIILLLCWFVICEARSAFTAPSDTPLPQESKIVENEEAIKQDDTRISAIEDQVHDALKTLDSIQSTYPKQFATVIQKYSNISLVQSTINRLILPPKCAELIQKGDFVRAHAILNFIHLDDYEEVVKEAFKNDTENFIKIVDFADTLGDGDNDKTFTFYQKLTDEAKTLGYSNVTGCYYALSNIEERKYNVRGNTKWEIPTTMLTECVFKSEAFMRGIAKAINAVFIATSCVIIGGLTGDPKGVCRNLQQNLAN